MQTPDEPRERFLHEILGERAVTRQEVGEPESARGRPLVDLGQPAPALIIGSHVGEHRRPFRTHITRTCEDPKSVVDLDGLWEVPLLTCGTSARSAWNRVVRGSENTPLTD